MLKTLILLCTETNPPTSSTHHGADLKPGFYNEADILGMGSFPEGYLVHNHYGPLGHPGYVDLNPSGEERWRGIGPLDMEELENQIIDSIDG